MAFATIRTANAFQASEDPIVVLSWRSLRVQIIAPGMAAAVKLMVLTNVFVRRDIIHQRAHWPRISVQATATVTVSVFLEESVYAKPDFQELVAT